jgi:hypothetical protein
VAAIRVARWDGQMWHAMGEGIPRDVSCLAVHDGTLYAGTGTRWHVYSDARVYRWDGVAWQCDVIGTGGGRIGALASYGGQLIIGGTFSVANGDTVRKICGLDGVTCRPLGGGIGGFGVLSLAVQGEDLLVGGGFYTAGDQAANYIARWDGSAWSALGSGLSGGPSLYGVYDILVHGDQVFAFGEFSNAGEVGANRVAMWNGQQWRGFGTGVGTRFVFAGGLLDGDLYVGGEFSQAGAYVAANFARWREPALAIHLSGFTAVRAAQGARLTWQVNGAGAEDGFQIWRQEAGRDRVRLTTAPVPAATAREFYDATAPAAATDYWLQAWTTTVSDTWYGPAHLAAIPIPTALALSQNHPNPFNPRTTLNYSLPVADRVKLVVYNVRGARVATLVDADQAAGEQTVEWAGTDDRGANVPSGLYFARLETAAGVRTVKVTLAK